MEAEDTNPSLHIWLFAKGPAYQGKNRTLEQEITLPLTHTPEFCEKSVYLASRLIIKGDLSNAVVSGKSIFGGCLVEKMNSVGIIHKSGDSNLCVCAGCCI